jgi:hypothetical protein
LLRRTNKPEEFIIEEKLNENTFLESRQHANDETFELRNEWHQGKSSFTYHTCIEHISSLNITGCSLNMFFHEPDYSGGDWFIDTALVP